MDPDKVKADVETVREQALELTGHATEGADDIVDQASDTVKSDEK